MERSRINLQRAIGAYHLVETADVGDHIGTMADNLLGTILHEVIG